MPEMGAGMADGLVWRFSVFSGCKISGMQPLRFSAVSGPGLKRFFSAAVQRLYIMTARRFFPAVTCHLRFGLYDAGQRRALRRDSGIVPTTEKARPMRLSRNDLAIIRQYGEREARRWHRAGRYVFEVGERFNTERADMECSVNIACVSNHPDWDDTDLNQTHDWSTMRGELPDGPDGRAIFDFYIYVMERGERGELVCNVQAVCDAAGLLRIDADINKGIWTRDGQDL